MTELSLRRNTGIFGVLATLISLAQLPLYFMYDGAPPRWDILMRVMVSITGSALLVVFLGGFRLILRQPSLEMDWASTVALVSGLMWLTFSFVAQSMEAGTAIASKVPIDPTVEGALAPGQFLMFGSIGRLMTTLFLSASGFAILRGRLMPTWLGWLAWMIALVNLAFVPAMFFGSDAARFYSAVGWGTTATAPCLVLCWVLIVAILLIGTPAEREA
ncbi:hypothetical protein DYQ86_05015 [Acidobacteria bacterium AB60]|nr:hypothetical protein DYQ86_05015 [Acidobacteria bacterium AB60]